MSYTPRIAVLHEGFPALDELDVAGIPVGSLLRTSDGHYYRLAESDEDVTGPPRGGDDDALAGPVAATAANPFRVLAQPDVPRNVTATVSAAALAWDGGPITVRGVDTNDRMVSEDIQPLGAPAGASLSTPGRVVGTQKFKRIDAISKALVGSSTATVTLGFGELVEFSPDVVAVREFGSMRWLKADDEVVVAAVPRLYLWDTRDRGNTDAMRQGAADLQEAFDSIHHVLRSVINAMAEGGISLTHDLEQFQVSER